MGCSLFWAMFEPLCYFINIIGEDVFNRHICFLWFFGPDFLAVLVEESFCC